MIHPFKTLCGFRVRFCGRRKIPPFKVMAYQTFITAKHNLLWLWEWFAVHSLITKAMLLFLMSLKKNICKPNCCDVGHSTPFCLLKQSINVIALFALAICGLLFDFHSSFFHPRSSLSSCMFPVFKSHPWKKFTSN